jgi:hypothetical protein
LLADLHVCITTSASCADGDPWWHTLMPIVVGVVGTVLGYGLSRLGGRSDRAYQRRREEFERQTLVVQPLDNALVEAQRRLSDMDVPEGQSCWKAAHAQWEDGWIRQTPWLADAELEARYQSVGSILIDMDGSRGRDQFKIGPAKTVAHRAILNARLALSYWLRGEELPPNSFPKPQELTELLGMGHSTPLAPDAPLRKWLDEHPAPPWRRPSPRRRRVRCVVVE